MNKEVTQLFNQWQSGDQAVQEQLSQLIYQELHRLASFYMQKENQGHTLQATAIVNEVYIQLNNQNLNVNNRQHLFALVSNMMRRYLVNHAKTKLTQKRGGDWSKVEINSEVDGQQLNLEQLLDFDEALDELAKIDERKAQIIEQRYFGGLELEEIAKAFNISESTLHRDIKVAKMWLMERMS